MMVHMQQRRQLLHRRQQSYNNCRNHLYCFITIIITLMGFYVWMILLVSTTTTTTPTIIIKKENESYNTIENNNENNNVYYNTIKNDTFLLHGNNNNNNNNNNYYHQQQQNNNYNNELVVDEPLHHDVEIINMPSDEEENEKQEDQEEEEQQSIEEEEEEQQQHDIVTAEKTTTTRIKEKSGCQYDTLNDLSNDELYPTEGDRHMVTPPKGGKVYLICCNTTKGYMNFIIHEKWAPIGSKRVIDMIESNYFNNPMGSVPFMRCLGNFLCQFGLNSNPSLTVHYNTHIIDDTNWLPEGPNHRTNSNGISRYAKGYLGFAGSGKNSRTNQLIVSLNTNQRLGGGSPWEVPWGEIIGTTSFITLSKIYTGYGEHGPTQGQLHRVGMTNDMKLEFPSIDYIVHCKIVDTKILSED